MARRTLSFLDGLMRDLQYGGRALLRSPSFSVVAIASLALGIGANTTMFSVAHAVLYRPLPFDDPDRLVVIHEQNAKTASQRLPPLASIIEWQEQARSFEQIEGIVWYAEANTVAADGGAERVRIQFLTPGAFSLLGMRPARGRLFTAADAVTGNRSAIISEGLWQRLFAGAPDIVQRTLRVGDLQWPIVGVLPGGSWTTPWLPDIDVWVPIDLRVNELTPQTRWLTAHGRLKASATIEQAQAEMDVLARRLAEQQPGVYRDWGLKIEPLAETYARGAGSVLYMLLGASGFVLLIACANVANLLLARGAGRQREVAIRLSLGAGRGRVFQHVLTESLLLSLIGGAAGVLVGWGGLRIFLAMASEGFPRAAEIAIDGNVLLFTCVVSLLTGILFGLAPAWRATTVSLVSMLKESGRPSAGGGRHRTNRLLAVAETALAFVLLVGAGLLINSVVRLQHVDVGYEADNLLSGRVQLGSSKYVEVLPENMKRVTPQAPLFYARVKERLASIPGVRSAAIASAAYSQRFRVAGRPESDQTPQASVQEIGPDYFQTLAIPVRKGRVIDERDRDSTQWVAVVNETLARSVFGSEEPIGKLLHLRFGGNGVDRDDERPRLIVGVVADIKSGSPAQRPAPAIYTSDQQHQWAYPSGGSAIHLQKTLYVRTAADPAGFVGSMREVVSEVDRDQTAFDVMPETQRLELRIGRWRFFRNLYAIFAGLAVTLAIVGVYGLVSYSVAERRREFGIRMALGAEKPAVLRHVLGQGLLLSATGIAIGIVAGFGLTRFLGNLLFGITPHDPMTFVVVSVVMLGVALASCYVPARRATSVDPADVLRAE
jgi:predicted permease